MTKVAKVHVKDQIIPVKAQNELLLRLALIMEPSNVNHNKVLYCLLGQHTWPLATRVQDAVEGELDL